MVKDLPPLPYILSLRTEDAFLRIVVEACGSDTLGAALPLKARHYFGFGGR
jgi:hypothetical protein